MIVLSPDADHAPAVRAIAAHSGLPDLYALGAMLRLHLWVARTSRDLSAPVTGIATAEELAEAAELPIAFVRAAVELGVIDIAPEGVTFRRRKSEIVQEREMWRIRKRVASPQPVKVKIAALRRGSRNWFTAQECALELGVTEGTLANWRKAGAGPAWSKMPQGKRVRYAKADVEAWLGNEKPPASHK